MFTAFAALELASTRATLMALLALLWTLARLEEIRLLILDNERDMSSLARWVAAETALEADDWV